MGTVVSYILYLPDGLDFLFLEDFNGSFAKYIGVQYLFFKAFFKIFIYFERETHSVSRGGTEREGDTESEEGSRL